MITLVIFSMDRAMQLDSLLRSIKDHVTGVNEVRVITRVSSDLHRRAYLKLHDYFPGDLFVNQFQDGPESPDPVPLGACLSFALGLENDTSMYSGPPADHVGLAVDDMVFFRPSDYRFAAETLDFKNGFLWSWRLGHRSPAEWSVAWTRGKGGDRREGAYWSCSPLETDRDYNYMFHTDGSLYRRADLVEKLNRFLPGWQRGKFIPNDMEASVMESFVRWRFSAGPHLGPLAQTCVTWQLNKESTTKGRYGAPWVTVPETELDAMAEAYLAGKRVDNEKLYSTVAGVESDLSWVTRFNGPGDRTTHIRACEEASKFYASLIR